jgi:ribosomal protein S18 acetylase RimI-like enzyme
LSEKENTFELMRTISTANVARPSLLPASMRQQMEQIFKTSLEKVTVRISPAPWLLGANAFAFGYNLYFAPGKYNCSSEEGLALLGHELAHVVQQSQSRTGSQSVSTPTVLKDQALEEEAEWFGEMAANRVRPCSGATLNKVAPFPVAISLDACTLNLSIGARHAGKITVSPRNHSTIELTNLMVEPALQKLGLGRLLIDSAVRLGKRTRKTNIVLTAADQGEGRLIRWYQQIGLTRVGYDRHFPQLGGRIEMVLASLSALRIGNAFSHFSPTFPRVNGASFIQCMDDDEERRRQRAARFGQELNAMAAQNAANEQNKNQLRHMVNMLSDAIAQNAIQVIASGQRVFAHGYRDPARTFIDRLLAADYTVLEANINADGELVVTVRMSNGHTVTGAWNQRNNVVRVFHCGETTSGVGYGTPLGY